MDSEQKYKDGFYDFVEVKDVLNNDFVSEKDLCDYIEKNIGLFCADCLGVQVSEYSREFPLNGSVRLRTKGNKRLDFLIITKCGKSIAVECKRPTFLCELSAAVGQVLSYIALFERMERKIDRFVILSTKIDGTLPLIIKRFNLPIEFIAFDKDKFLTYMKDASTTRK